MQDCLFVAHLAYRTISIASPVMLGHARKEGVLTRSICHSFELSDRVSRVESRAVHHKFIGFPVVRSAVGVIARRMSGDAVRHTPVHSDGWVLRDDLGNFEFFSLG